MSGHLLIVAYAFPPVSAVGAMRPLRMVKYLDRDSRWQATVICVERKLMRQDPSLAAEIPASTAVHRVRSWEPYAWLDGLTIRRAAGVKAPTPMDVVPEPAGGVAASPAQAGRRQLLRDLLATPDPQGWWNVPVVARALALHRRRPFDAVLVTSPPWSAQLAGAVLGRLLRIPWLADYRDPWNDIDRRNRSPFFTRLSIAFENALLPHAAAVISTSDTYTEILRRRYPGRPADVFTTLYNGFDEAKIPTEPQPAGAKFTIVHLGALYDIWQPFAFFRALQVWLTRNPTRRREVCLKFVGRPGASTLAVLSSLGLSDIIQVTGFVAHAEAIRECRAADLLLLALGDAEGVPSGWLPSKLFEYIAFNRPILANIGQGEAKRLIEAAGAGRVVGDADEAGFLAVLDEFYQRKLDAPGGQIPWQNKPDAVARLTQRHLVQELVARLDRVTARRVEP